MPGWIVSLQADVAAPISTFSFPPYDPRLIPIGLFPGRHRNVTLSPAVPTPVQEGD